MFKDFYLGFTTASFTVLSIWMFVVQARRTDWAHSGEHLRRAYAIHLQFGLAGLMSMLSLVKPDSKALWRASFSVVSGLGAVALILLRQRRSKGWDAVAELGHLASAAIFAVIFVVAAAPRVPKRLGIDLEPLGIEAIALSLMIFLGVNMAWLLMFDEVPADRTGR